MLVLIQTWRTTVLLAFPLLLTLAADCNAQNAARAVLADATQQSVRSQEIVLESLDRGHSPPVITALASSSDGMLLAAAGDDHAIRIINADSGDIVRTLQGHRDWIQSLAFATNSHTLYSAANDGKVLKWTEASDLPTKVVQLPYAIRSISVSAKLHMLAIGGFHPEVLLLGLDDFAIEQRLICKGKDQRCVRFSPDGRYVLCGGNDGDLCVWATTTGQEVAHFQEHSGRIYTASFNVDGTRITSAGEDRHMVQYDLQRQEVVLRRELAQAKLKSLCMINNDLIAVSGADNSIHLYDALADEVTAHLEAHEGTVAVMDACGELLVSGSFDTTIRIWDLTSIDLAGLEVDSKPVALAPIKVDSQLRIK